MSKYKYTKETIREFIQALFDESKANAKANWMITLHPGYRHASTKTWRDSSKENAKKATYGFIRLMNSFLVGGSNMNRYVKGMLFIEKSGNDQWHTHMIIQQTVQDEDAFIKRLKKLDEMVNRRDYVPVDGMKTYKGAKGIGYKNENGSYMHYQKLDDDYDRIGGYQIKMDSTLVGILNQRSFSEEFFEIEPERITINKREWAEREQYERKLKEEASHDQAEEQTRPD